MMTSLLAALFAATLHSADCTPFPMPSIRQPVFRDRDYALTDFVAKSDGPKCTAAFAAAMAKCAAEGGGRIVVPRGTWLTGAIHFRSNCNLHLEDGAEILFTTDPADYPVVFTSWESIECYNHSPLVYAFACTNVAITGQGTLRAFNGRFEDTLWKSWVPNTGGAGRSRRRLYDWGANGTPVEERRVTDYPESNLRPHHIQFNRCRNVLLEGVKVRNVRGLVVDGKAVAPDHPNGEPVAYYVGDADRSEPPADILAHCPGAKRVVNLSVRGKDILDMFRGHSFNYTLPYAPGDYVAYGCAGNDPKVRFEIEHNIRGRSGIPVAVGASAAEERDCKLFLWVELIGFDNTRADYGVGQYLDTIGRTPDAITLLFNNDNLFRCYDPKDTADFTLPPNCCSYGARPFNRLRKRQAWKASELKGLVAELKKHGIDVFASFFWYKDMPVAKELHDGIVAKLVPFLCDFGFTGYHGADGYAPPCHFNEQWSALKHARLRRGLAFADSAGAMNPSLSWVRGEFCRLRLQSPAKTLNIQPSTLNFQLSTF